MIRVLVFSLFLLATASLALHGIALVVQAELESTKMTIKKVSKGRSDDRHVDKVVHTQEPKEEDPATQRRVKQNRARARAKLTAQRLAWEAKHKTLSQAEIKLQNIS